VGGTIGGRLSRAKLGVTGSTVRVRATLGGNAVLIVDLSVQLTRGESSGGLALELGISDRGACASLSRVGAGTRGGAVSIGGRESGSANSGSYAIARAVRSSLANLNSVTCSSIRNASPSNTRSTHAVSRSVADSSGGAVGGGELDANTSSAVETSLAVSGTTDANSIQRYVETRSSTGA